MCVNALHRRVTPLLRAKLQPCENDMLTVCAITCTPVPGQVFHKWVRWHGAICKSLPHYRIIRGRMAVHVMAVHCLLLARLQCKLTDTTHVHDFPQQAQPQRMP